METKLCQNLCFLISSYVEIIAENKFFLKYLEKYRNGMIKEKISSI